MACSGAGIVAMADEFTEPYLRSGQLLPVLPDWRLPENTAWAVFPGRRLMPRRTRVFLDALEQYFSPAECEEHRVRTRLAKAQYRYDPGALQDAVPGLAPASGDAIEQDPAAPRRKRKTQPA
jgi:hypothetical protein